MTESESVALPLGDAPFVLTTHIITDVYRFVKPFLQKFLRFFLFFSAFFASLKKSDGSARLGLGARGGAVDLLGRLSRPFFALSPAARHLEKPAPDRLRVRHARAFLVGQVCFWCTKSAALGIVLPKNAKKISKNAKKKEKTLAKCEVLV